MEGNVLPISQTVILKYPYYGNDSFIFQMKDLKIGMLEFGKIFGHNARISAFAAAKVEMFQKMDTEPASLKDFVTSIPSCKNVMNIDSLSKTNYRVALRNMNSNIYRHIYDMRKVGSRRCVLNFANSVPEYAESERLKEDFHKDISCLSQIIIHEDNGHSNVTIIYRASDMAYDFLVDFYTLLKYVLFSDLFLDVINLTWISNTCQFHNGVTEDMNEIRGVFQRNSDVYKEKS